MIITNRAEQETLLGSQYLMCGYYFMVIWLNTNWFISSLHFTQSYRKASFDILLTYILKQLVFNHTHNKLAYSSLWQGSKPSWKYWLVSWS